MAWTWRYENGEGQPAEGPTETFTSQADAESWVGEFYADLAEEGIAAVTLFEGDREVYGPMGLGA